MGANYSLPRDLDDVAAPLNNNKWKRCSIRGLQPKIGPPSDSLPIVDGYDAVIPPHFWGKTVSKNRRHSAQQHHQPQFPTHRGYAEARELIGDGNLETINQLSLEALSFVRGVFEAVDSSSSSSSSPPLPSSSTSVPPNNDTQASPSSASTSSSSSSRPAVVNLRLSSALEAWKQSQHAAGRVLPPKGKGLTRASDAVLSLLGASDWPEALITTNSLFGCGIASMLIGAHDPRVMFSNYVTDMAFYYEHGYHYVFPDLEPLIVAASARDRHALRTLGGPERRAAVAVGIRYIRAKVALEEEHKADLSGKSARMDRRTMQTVSLCESSLLGMAEEAVVRGFDPAAVMSDLVFSSPGTDVVDVGCDLLNSEVMNSFLNTADVTRGGSGEEGAGVVTEKALRDVYDAVAHTGARMLVQRWSEPVARMCAALYTWHMVNDRHMFLRRCVLGWPMARKGREAREGGGGQREADFDEAFDEDYRTTGFSRPLEGACNGGWCCEGNTDREEGDDTCDVVHDFLLRQTGSPLPRRLWEALVTEPLAYVRAGVVSAEREARLEEQLRLMMASMYAAGLVLEMVWLVAHANHHAWQVNYLFEAAMFGSLLDGGSLAGKLDRAEKGAPTVTNANKKREASPRAGTPTKTAKAAKRWSWRRDTGDKERRS